MPVLMIQWWVRRWAVLPGAISAPFETSSCAKDFCFLVELPPSSCHVFGWVSIQFCCCFACCKHLNIDQTWRNSFLVCIVFFFFWQDKICEAYSLSCWVFKHFFSFELGKDEPLLSDGLMLRPRTWLLWSKPLELLGVGHLLSWEYLKSQGSELNSTATSQKQRMIWVGRDL